MEYFDILDEQGNKTGGVITRDAAHKRGLWHKAVHAWIVNDKNQILIQKRAAIKESHPNMWDISIAGHVAAGDDSITTCIREAKEEIGIDLDESDFEFLLTLHSQCILNNNTYFNNEYHDIYIIKRNLDIEKLTLQEEEVAEVKFINLTNLKKKIEEKDPEFVMHDEEYRALFKYLEK
ncbi:MAG: NUDIX hydrolase [Candidatus Komeilibacteria bacterium]